MGSNFFFLYSLASVTFSNVSSQIPLFPAHNGVLSPVSSLVWPLSFHLRLTSLSNTFQYLHILVDHHAFCLRCPLLCLENNHWAIVHLLHYLFCVIFTFNYYRHTNLFNNSFSILSLHYAVGFLIHLCIPDLLYSALCPQLQHRAGYLVNSIIIIARCWIIQYS